MVFPTQQQSFEVIQLSSHQCGNGNFSMQIKWRFLNQVWRSVILHKKCRCTWFDQILAHILMITALLKTIDLFPVNDCISCWSYWNTHFDEVFDILYPFFEVIHGILHYQLRRGHIVTLMKMANFFCNSCMHGKFFIVVWWVDGTFYCLL